MAALTAAGHPWPAVSNTRPVRRIGYLLVSLLRFAIKSREAAFFIGRRDDWWRLSGVPITKRISWSD